MSFSSMNCDSKKVGIIGGGQLALMLTEAAIRMGLLPLILTEDAHSPISQCYPHFLCGTSRDEKALEQLFSQVHLVIFENEFVDCELLERVSRNSSRFFPSLKVIATFQDKLKQKHLLQKLDIPNAKFRLLDNIHHAEDFQQQVSEAMAFFEGSCVLKWSRMGHDGKGVLFLDSSSEEKQKIETFRSEALKRQSSIYAEQKIDFKRELALISVHSINGDFVTYPLVITEQVGGICVRVKGPATALGVSAEFELLAQRYARRIAQTSELVGTFAIEFFETSSGELWVNELAPRVHNSGHFTQNACNTDQFENHWRAILGMPLGSVDSQACFAMLNILGAKGDSSQDHLPLPGSRSHLHWYHKRETPPGRKLGHLNGVAKSPEDIEGLLNEMDHSNKEWLRRKKNEPNS
jgi:5-(carboxyamino)imidazole ribonucleotide synthase